METSPHAKRSNHTPTAAATAAAQFDQELLPGLPDHVAHLCLARLPATLLYTVCHAWRHYIYTPSFPPFLCLYALLRAQDRPLGWFSFDPIASDWLPLPPDHPQPSPPFLLRHPSFIGRHLPVQSIAAAGNLVMLAATTDGLAPALPRPLIFQTRTGTWSLGPPISAPRRWCTCGTVSGAVYLASGVGSEWSLDVARSTERWIPGSSNWEPVAPLKSLKFSMEAIEAVGWKGKLCMVNVMGKGVKEGVVYEVLNGEWGVMPEEMVCGWTGPVAAMEERVLYVVDEVTGVLREFDERGGVWVTVVASPLLRGVVQIAAGGGKVCGVCAGGGAVVVVDVVARPARIWVVGPPPETQVVTIHILPRMSSPKS